jgi:hypothetical protein
MDVFRVVILVDPENVWTRCDLGGLWGENWEIWFVRLFDFIFRILDYLSDLIMFPNLRKLWNKF